MALQPLIPAEQNNEVSWYTSGLAGIVSGGIKVVEGAFSLGAELVDLGLDTNTAAQVEIFFDKLNPLEEIAEQTGVGKLTQALVQIGVPGGAGFKLGTKLYNRYFEAKKAGKLVSAGSKNLAKQKYQGKGYGPNEGINRTLTRQFLADEIEAGRIETTPDIYNAMREGGHPFIDSIKVFRHHYGDDAFDKLGEYIDSTYDFMSGSIYPGRFEFRKLGLVPKNKKAPGKTYAHYSTPSEIDAEIQSIDNLISDYQQGKSPMIRTKQELLEGIREQNKRRAQFVKIRNEIAPEETKVQPGDELLETAEVVPIKEEGILTGVDNTAEKLKKLEGKTFKGVELYGDETFDELKYIDENAESLNGVHPRDMDLKEGFARGGIVEVLI